MREIKFRFWDTTRKEMIQVKQMIIPKGLNEHGNQELSVSGLEFGANPSHWRIAPPLMQYTGLKDKNGVEIYEGDIVRYAFDYKYDEESIGTSQVWYCVNHFRYETDDYDLAELDEDAEWIEVIGNIWENLELITNKGDS